LKGLAGKAEGCKKARFKNKHNLPFQSNFVRAIWKWRKIIDVNGIDVK
jgi:hypothetical protein